VWHCAVDWIATRAPAGVLRNPAKFDALHLSALNDAAVDGDRPLALVIQQEQVDQEKQHR
jgi:hypothetical protein